MSSLPDPSDPQALVYATEIRELYHRERARADELQRAKDELQAAHERLLTEIRERETAEQALRQAQKMEAVGQLAGGIAHDFNNLLSVIINYASFLEEDLSEMPEALDDLRAIRSAGQRAADLTRQLLAFSRKEVVQPRVVNVAETVVGLEKMLRRVIREDIQLDIAGDEGTWPVKIDPGQLEQVVLNLVVNARDAMPAGGTLTIRVGDRAVDEIEAERHPGLRAGEYGALIVEDDGVGMEPEVLARIFEPFFTTKARDVGTGLGLASVYGIVKGADGYILCESEPRRGTTFTVFLPRTTEADQKLSSTSTAAAKELDASTILVIDDEGGVRRAVERILTSRGHSVLAAASGEEAVEIVGETGGVDAVVADIIMPGLSGAALVAVLRSLEPDVPIVLMSGYSEETALQNGVSALGLPIVPKPVTPDPLLAALEAALRAGANKPAIPANVPVTKP